MLHKNAYALRNLPAPRKLLVSSALVLGLALFLSGWAVSIFAANWALSLMTVLDWGARLGMLGPEWDLGLLFVHVVSLGLLLRLTLALMKHMPLPRLSRRALYF